MRRELKAPERGRQKMTDHTTCGCYKKQKLKLYVVQFPGARLMRVDVPHLFDDLYVVP